MKENNGLWYETYRTLADIIYCLIFVTVLFVFAVRLVGVVGDSMYPTLHEGDRLTLLSNVLYEPEVGDIVVLRAVDYSSEPIVKRVIADEGQTIDINFQTGEVTVDGEPADYRPLVALVMNKPAGVLTATTDRRQKTVLDLLPESDRRRDPAPVGRLDKDTTGLLLITDDGKAAHGLISPKSGVEKRYRAVLDAPATEADVEAFARGLSLSDFEAMPAKLEIGEGNVAWCTVQEGKFHQVKKMFLSCSVKVVHLQRISIGNLYLDSKLPTGSCKKLTNLDKELIFMGKIH